MSPDPREMLKTAEAALAEGEAQVARWRPVVNALRAAVRSDPVKPTPPRGPAGFATLSSTAAAEAILREAGGPLRLTEIVGQIQKRGYKPELDANTLYSRLYTELKAQAHRFSSPERGIWDLVNR